MLHEVPNLFLTDSFISNIKCPSGKDQIIYWDHPKTLDGRIRNGSQPGLGLRVTANGAKAFIHGYQFNGKRKRAVVGKTQSMSITAARLSVQERNGQIDDGINPEALKTNHRLKTTLTFRDISEEYFHQHMSKLSEKHKWEFARLIAPWFSKRPNTKNRKGSNKRKSFPAFGIAYEECAAEQITPTDIGRFINRIESDSVANSALLHIKALYNWAIRMQIIDVRNPCSPHKKRKIIKCRRDYTPDNIAALSSYIFNPPVEALEITTALKDDPKQLALARGRVTTQNAQMNELCHFLGILFLTMARPNELRNAKFEHFDLNQLIWHKHNTKGIKLSRATYEYASRSVPIHLKVAELINQQKQCWPSSEYAFPSHTDQTQPRDNFKRTLKRFKSLDGIPAHFQMYDIKRIAISLMLTGQGIRREDVSHYVDHKGNLETTMIYDLGFVDPMRPVAEKMGELLGV